MLLSSKHHAAMSIKALPGSLSIVLHGAAPHCRSHPRLVAI